MHFIMWVASESSTSPTPSRLYLLRHFRSADRYTVGSDASCSSTKVPKNPDTAGGMDFYEKALAVKNDVVAAALDLLNPISASVFCNALAPPSLRLRVLSVKAIRIQLKSNSSYFPPYAAGSRPSPYFGVHVTRVIVQNGRARVTVHVTRVVVDDSGARAGV